MVYITDIIVFFVLWFSKFPVLPDLRMFAQALNQLQNAIQEVAKKEIKVSAM